MRISYAHVQDFNRETVEEYPDILEAEMRITDYLPDKIFNVDAGNLVENSAVKCSTGGR